MMSVPAILSALGLAVALISVVGARHRWTIVRVRGDSMIPTYTDGDRLLVRRTGGVVAGDPVVFRLPTALPGATDLTEGGLQWLVKRVVALPGDPVPREVRDVVGVTDDAVVPPGSFVVRGDNPSSLDSRQFGYLPVASILGKPVRIFSA